MDLQNQRDYDILWMLAEFFDPREAWGEPKKMHPLQVLVLNGFRASLPAGCWVKLHNGYKEGGHTENSFHYKGEANDFHVVGCPFLEAEKQLIHYLRKPRLVEKKEYRLIDYCGVGNYPQWNNPGFHLDIRGNTASWSRIDGKYVAYELGLEWAKNNLNQ